MPLPLRLDNALASSRLSWRQAVAALILVHFSLLLWIGLTRHWGFMTSLNDLGMFDQAVWGTLHGRPFLNTSSPFNVPINWLGWHFNPILLLFVPLYAIAEAPEWLILAQAAALSFSAWPLFSLAARMAGSQRAGALWTIAYLANPFLLNAAAWDFHAVSLAVPFIVLGMLAVESRNARLMVGACLLLLTVQEQMGIMVAGFGALWWLRNGAWRVGAGLIVLGLGYTCLILGVVMPALSPSHTHPMLSEGVGFASRYGWLGSSLGQIVAAPLRHPWMFMKTVFVDLGGGTYLAVLLLSFFYYPLAGAAFLLPGLADLAVNLLSANSMPRSPFSYHSVGLVPIFTVAAIQGSRVLACRQKRFGAVELAGLAAVASLITGYVLAPLPLPGTADYWAARHFPLAPDPALPSLRAALPATSSLSVQANLGGHFSQRHRIHVFPARIDAVDAVVLRLDSPTKEVGFEPSEEVASLSHHLQMDPGAYLTAVEALVADPGYGVLVWRDPWLVLARGQPAQEPSARAEILARLAALRSAWRAGGGRPVDREELTWRH